MRHRFVTVLLAVVVAVTVVAVPGTACACSCVSSRASEQVERATVVFTGTVVAVRQAPASTIGPPPPIVYAFRADRVYKGEGQVGAGGIEVASEKDEATCGYSFTVGSRYLVFASDRSGNLAGKDPGVPLSTTLCDGNRQVRPGDGPLRGRDGVDAGETLPEELLAALGTAEPPQATRVTPEAAPRGLASPAPASPVAGASDASGPGTTVPRLLVGLVVAAAVLVLAGWGLRRRGR
ncbi:hypothetical protein ACLQ2R_04125 [Streptosporangium sp. DT93]|uniref:hypothetical protein n=1 Tax=Streptosporangium sp. DT93 TaxID=3393428 RepID=UPI003CED2BE3